MDVTRTSRQEERLRECQVYLLHESTQQTVREGAADIARQINWEAPIRPRKPRRTCEGTLTGRKKTRMHRHADESSFATLDGAVVTLNRAGGKPAVQLRAVSVKPVGDTGFVLNTRRHAYAENCESKQERDKWVASIQSALSAETSAQIASCSSAGARAIDTMCFIATDRSFGEDIEAKECAAACFVKLALSGEAGQLVLTDSERLPAVLTALTQLLSTQRAQLVQEQACFLLRSMTGWQGGLQKEMLAAGCLPPLLAVITRSWTSVTTRLVDQAVGTIGNLTAHHVVAGALIEGGTTQALTLLLKSSTPVPSLASQKFACFALANLARDAAAQRKLANANVVGALAAVLQVPRRSAYDIIAAAHAPMSRAQSVVAAAILDGTTAHRATTPDAVQHAHERLARASAREQACRALRNIAARDPEARALIMKKQAGQALGPYAPVLLALSSLMRAAELNALDTDVAKAGGDAVLAATLRVRNIEVSVQAAATLANLAEEQPNRHIIGGSVNAATGSHDSESFGGVQAALAALRSASSAVKKLGTDMDGADESVVVGTDGRRLPPYLASLQRLQSMLLLALLNMVTDAAAQIHKAPAEARRLNCAAVLHEAGEVDKILTVVEGSADLTVKANGFRLLHQLARQSVAARAALVQADAARIFVEHLCSTGGQHAAQHRAHRQQKAAQVNTARAYAAAALGELMSIEAQKGDTMLPHDQTLGSAVKAATTVCVEVKGSSGGGVSEISGAVGVNVLLHILAAHTEKLETKAKAAAALASLARLPPVGARKDSVGASTGTTKWANAIMRGQDAVSTLMSCIEATVVAQHTAPHALSLFYLEQLGIETARILMALSRHPECRTAICAVTKTSSESKSQPLAAVDALLRMCEYKGGNSSARVTEVRAAAFGALANLALGDSEVKKKIGHTASLRVFIGALQSDLDSSGEDGGGKSVVSAQKRQSMLSDEEWHGLREKAAALLGNLASADPHNQRKLGGVGALKVLADSLANGLPTQPQPFSTTDLASMSSRIRAAGAIRVLVRHQDNENKLLRLEVAGMLLHVCVVALYTVSSPQHASSGVLNSRCMQLAVQAMGALCNMTAWSSAAQKQVGETMLDQGWITWSSANIQPDAVSVEGGAQNAGKPAMSSAFQVLLAIGATPPGDGNGTAQPSWQLPLKLREKAFAVLRNTLASSECSRSFCLRTSDDSTSLVFGASSRDADGACGNVSWLLCSMRDTLSALQSAQQGDSNRVVLQEILFDCIAAVVNVALVNTECRQALISSGAITHTTALLVALAGWLQNEPDDSSVKPAEMAKLVAAAVEHLSREGAAVQSQFSTADCLAALTTMVEMDEDFHICARATYAIWSIMVDNDATQNAVHSAKITVQLVGNLTSGNDEVCAASAGALWNMVANAGARADIVKFQGVEKLLALRGKQKRVQARGPGRERARSGVTNDAYSPATAERAATYANCALTALASADAAVASRVKSALPRQAASSMTARPSFFFRKQKATAGLGDAVIDEPPTLDTGRSERASTRLSDLTEAETNQLFGQQDMNDAAGDSEHAHAVITQSVPPPKPKPAL